MSERVLLDLQGDLLGRAEADEFIGAVKCVAQRKGNIENDIAEGLGLVTKVSGKSGACVILLAPIGDVEYPDAPGGPLLIEVTFLVLEIPVVNNGANGTQKSAEELARRLVRVFQHYQPAGFGTTLSAKKPTIVPVANPLAQVSYEVRFECVEFVAEDFNKVMTPQLSVDEGAAPQVVAITCGTAGAAIYYTTDGSYPSAGNANATLYAAPVAVNAAAMLRAAASKAGYIDSDVACGIYS